MYKLTRRSLAAAVRSVVVRSRTVFTPASSSPLSSNQWISVLASVSHGVTDFTKEPCLSNGLAKRFESTAAASDAASPPDAKCKV